MDVEQAKKDAAGHRKRLREKLLKSGLEGFPDYEVVELLLTLGKPRTDTKPQAKEAIRRFKTLRGVLEAPPEDLQKIDGIGPHSVFGLKIVQEVARRYLKEGIIDREYLSSSQAVYEYFYHTMRDLKKETIKAVYLNAQNQIQEFKDFQEGTVDSSYVYPREILQGAIKANAVSVVLVHNHPTGNPNPSEADRELTRNLVFATAAVQVRVLDHLIIGDNRYYSFAGDGLISRYESEFSRLKIKVAEEPR
jgi:DNA repair protein RadC